MALDDHLLDAALDLEAKHIADREIEAAIHDPEAVRRADHRVGRRREVVVLDDLDAFAVVERLVPRAHERRVSIDENHPFGYHRVNHTLFRVDGTRFVVARHMRSFVIAALIASSIRASADDTPPGTGSYRMQTLGVDGLTAGLFVGAFETRGRASDRLLDFALAGLVIGAPTIHLIHRRWGSAATSL